MVETGGGGEPYFHIIWPFLAERKAFQYTGSIILSDLHLASQSVRSSALAMIYNIKLMKLWPISRDL